MTMDFPIGWQPGAPAEDLVAAVRARGGDLTGYSGVNGVLEFRIRPATEVIRDYRLLLLHASDPGKRHTLGIELADREAAYRRWRERTASESHYPDAELVFEARMRADYARLTQLEEDLAELSHSGALPVERVHAILDQIDILRVEYEPEPAAAPGGDGTGSWSDIRSAATTPSAAYGAGSTR